MEKKTLEINKNNLQATIASLNEDKHVALKSLNSELQKLKDAKNNLAIFCAESEEEEKKIVARIEKLKAKEMTVDQKIQTFNSREAKYKSNVRRSKDEEKTQNKKLNKLNEHILEAEKEEKTLLARIVELNKTIVEKEELSTNILTLKNEVEGLTVEKQKIQFKTDEIQRLTKKGLADMKLEVLATEERQKDAEEALEQAKYARNELNVDIDRIKHDIEITVERLEEKYKEAFPNLRLNIKL